ncbi:AAA family ATPase [Novosphingobium sp.]|uniref:AAA family ATPase n=1 Tax=Novosphingobium sp. TaxID=1874826 RepID=UPI0035B32422
MNIATIPLRPTDRTLSNVEAEAALLGAALIENTVLDLAAERLAPCDFYEPTHGRIFDLAARLRANGSTVTALTLKSHLSDDEGLIELGGLSYLARLTGDAQGLLAPAELIGQIGDLSTLRRVAEIGNDLRSAALESGGAVDPGAILADAQEALTSLRATRPGAVASPFVWRDPATIPPRPWIVGRWLLLGTVACVVAPGGAGKSTFIAALAASLASGREIIGKRLPRGRQRVWLWNLEDDLDELHRSLAAACLHHDIAPNELEDWLFVDSGLEGATLCTARDERDGFRLETRAFDAVATEIRRRAIDVLVIDPFVSSHQVNESENGRIDAIAKAWARIAKATNCLIILVHHVAKAGAGEVTANSARGAVSLINAARSVLVLNRMEEADADRLGIAAAERRRYIRIGDDKSNRAPAEAADWFRIASVDLGNSDSVGALEAWQLPGLFDDVSLDDLRTVQARIGERDWRENHQASDWCGRLVAEVLGLDISEKAGKAKAAGILKEWIKSGSLRIEERADRNRETRKYVVMGEPA